MIFLTPVQVRAYYCRNAIGETAGPPHVPDPDHSVSFGFSLDFFQSRKFSRSATLEVKRDCYQETEAVQSNVSFFSSMILFIKNVNLMDYITVDWTNEPADSTTDSLRVLGISVLMRTQHGRWAESDENALRTYTSSSTDTPLSPSFREHWTLSPHTLVARRSADVCNRVLCSTGTLSVCCTGRKERKLIVSLFSNLCRNIRTH